MKVHTVNGVDYRMPNELNYFQMAIYIHLINWKWKNISKDPGIYGNLEYDAILPDNCLKDGYSPLIYPWVAKVLEQHHSKNEFRIHQHFSHMASSQAANVNLFLPILLHPATDIILRSLKPDFAFLATEVLDKGFCIEFWGGNFNGKPISKNNKGPLGDKSASAGTDSDIAIAYHNHDGDLCLWLIEHKLTEAKFTECGGFKSLGRRAQHDCSKCFSDILKKKRLCYYHDICKFNYWELTDLNKAFFTNHANYSECPFKGGMNQLWRNQLLAMAIEQDPDQPYKYITFSVVKHPGNTYLDATLDAYKQLISNNPKFSTFTSADVLASAKAIGDTVLDQWITRYEDLYKI